MSHHVIDYHVAKAQGGSGFITIVTTVAAPLAKAGVNQLDLWSDEHIAGLKSVVDECHKYGARVSVQLCYAGRETDTVVAGCSKRLEIPRELTTEKIYELTQKFADAARRCRDAGADAVEVHAAPGYLAGRFLSLRGNKRASNRLTKPYGPTNILQTGKAHLIFRVR